MLWDARSTPDGCITDAKLRRMTRHVDGVVEHPRFRLGSTECAAGQFFVYTLVNGSITLSCHPCPANTFALSAEESRCQPCPAGMSSSAGVSRCDFATSSSSRLEVVLPVIIACAGLVAVVTGVLVNRRGAAKNRLAPKEPPLALIFTDVESSTKLWAADAPAMSAAIEIHHRVIREAIQEAGAYEVKTVGDSFMIAVSNLVDAALLCAAIQKQLFEAEWPPSIKYIVDDSTAADPALWNGLRVRIGLHWCLEVEPKYETLHQYYDYYGNDVNISARVESQAQGGQILVTEQTLKTLLDDPDYAEMVEPELAHELYDSNVELKGIDGTVSLYALVPEEFAGRIASKNEQSAGHRSGNDSPAVRSSRSSVSSASRASMAGESDIGMVLGIVLNTLKPAQRTIVMNTVATELRVKLEANNRRNVLNIARVVAERQRGNGRVRARKQPAEKSPALGVIQGSTPGDAHNAMLPGAAEIAGV